MRDLRRQLAGALGAAWFATACAPHLAVADNQPSGQDFSLIERGRYLAVLADCTGCHTDPNSEVQFGGGRSIETPFGNVLASNITPDNDTGIGAWSDDEFDAAVRFGKRPDGKLLYPAMPYPYYTHMSRADIVAIRAWLNTLPSVHNPVDENQLPFPFNIRTGMHAWDGLYFSPGSVKPNPNKSAQWNRGAYLVLGPGHCAACHTPKTTLGGDVSAKPLQGSPLQGWFAPDITASEALGLGKWSVEDIVAYLKTGHNRFSAATGPMAEEVADSTSHINAADLEAIAVFLKDQAGPSASGGTPLSAHDPAMVAGGAIYLDRCAACHREDGKGIPFLIPDLALASSVASREPTSLLRVVVHGSQSVATAGEPTAPAMPAFGWQLTDAQIAAVTTFVRNSWGHAAPATSSGEVHDVRERGKAMAD
ncbi:MAG TPA: c-type cytochrome [Steroidobacteraceae bacterium]|nr:c-type cytochrome [Steroidobacteraceae bacterium]